MYNKLLIAALVASSAVAFCPQLPAFHPSATVVKNGKADWGDAAELGWSMGGEEHTRDPSPQDSDDPRKSIPQGESFEEYMKNRQAMGQ